MLLAHMSKASSFFKKYLKEIHNCVIVITSFGMPNSEFWILSTQKGADYFFSKFWYAKYRVWNVIKSKGA